MRHPSLQKGALTVPADPGVGDAVHGEQRELQVVGGARGLLTAAALPGLLLGRLGNDGAEGAEVERDQAVHRSGEPGQALLHGADTAWGSKVSEEGVS